jgi:hypothetical protein
MARSSLWSSQKLHECRAMLAAGRGKRASFVAQRTLRRNGAGNRRGHDISDIIFGASGRRETFIQTSAMPVPMNMGSQARPEMEKHDELLDKRKMGK